MLPDEVRKAVQRIQNNVSAVRTVAYGDWDLVRAHLLAREAEVERLHAIERERWDVVATRNAAVMRSERAEALLREVAAEWEQGGMPISIPLHDSITAHLSENSRG